MTSDPVGFSIRINGTKLSYVGYTDAIPAKRRYCIEAADQCENCATHGIDRNEYLTLAEAPTEPHQE